VDRHFYELCALAELRDRLRSGDIWVTGSRQYRDFETYLIPAATFKAMQKEPLPLDVDTHLPSYMAECRQRLEDNLTTVAAKARENAVNHGALRRQEGGEVQVRATVIDDVGAPTLICEVQDNGPGLLTDAPRNGAKGLALVQARLDVMDVGARFRLELGHPGTRAILELPMRGILSKAT
jgi:hypothetical protein